MQSDLYEMTLCQGLSICFCKTHVGNPSVLTRGPLKKGPRAKAMQKAASAMA